MSIILECIRTVGRGERGRKPLNVEQAFAVMDAYLSGKESGAQDAIGDDQMAMLMMLIRVQNETNAEIAGFVKAFQSRVPNLGADIDWPCYAGKRVSDNGSDQPWHGLAAKILSTHGYKVLLHGYKDVASGRTHLEDCLGLLDIPLADHPQHAKQLLDEQNIAYLPLSNFAPIAQSMIGWKNRYGLRTPINTVVRALNPGGARLGVRGSFHPGFQQLHAEVDQEIDRKSLSVISFKGKNGESEYNPKVSQTVWLSSEKGVESFYWPERLLTSVTLPQTALFKADHEMQVQMANCVISNMAAVLFAQHKDQDMAYQQAIEFWQQYASHARSQQ
ncbi:glycosyl transferase family protein [Vibrio sp. S11_S32]|uniref:glycosyl transferase family protein n=1 Tax=Vibrio sp. S11_S32 TaxID=2720225 RepID=UPI0016815F39|nr:glycosyl transferase family protein [Vibrio sp. S11_S32]MBD1574909.1 glycosyl transferase family protein [Vibrio sp. S11_S32]